MCGIAGYFDLQGRPTCAGNVDFRTAALIAARDSLAHRGPDRSGLFEDQPAGVGLAHTRLSILDLSSAGDQPMFGADGSVVLIFNGEIYNFSELRTELQDRGVRFKGHSDTEVLLQLYLAEGQDLRGMLRRLNGIFAFALWDSRTQTMLIARDALGVKPLYIAESLYGIAFSSEIKALLPLLQETFSGADLDENALLNYLTFLWCPGEGTPLKAVRKLLPGQALIVKDGRIAERIDWYQLSVFKTAKAVLNESQIIAGTLSHLRQAVHRQMVADVPVGAFLSGGLDSSSVVALAREVNPKIHCFSIDATGGPEKGQIEDLPYARQVAAHLGVPLDVISISSAGMAAELEGMVKQLDEPLADPAPLNVLFISRLARSQGIKVLLSGAGGDDLFAGYRRHRALIAERYWSWLPQTVRAGAAHLANYLDQRHSTSRRIAKLLDVGVLNGDARIAQYFCWARREDLLALATPEFRELLAVHRATEPLVDFLATLPQGISPLERMLALEQRFFLADHNLVYTDKMSMAAGVEVRVPFLDLELVEFAAHIPDQFKQHGSIGKYALKKAMEPYLPHEIIYRQKTGFGAPLRRWMRVGTKRTPE
jgi:asparagine synthase (glutamine-hydrolysing)